MQILGYTYTVVRDGLMDDIGAMGRCHPARLRIQIAEDVAGPQVTSTLLHELLEALNYHLELGLGHNVLMALEAGLYQALRANGVYLEVLERQLPPCSRGSPRRTLEKRGESDDRGA